VARLSRTKKLRGFSLAPFQLVLLRLPAMDYCPRS
jgi:hypothetical protein